jgi:hypothetical protein
VTADRPGLKQAAAIGDLVVEVLRRQGLEGKIEEYRAWQVWDAVVGAQIAARARPVRIREGVLEVRVEQAVWMQQLQLMKPQILSRLNERLGKAVVRDIFWRRGRVEAVPGMNSAGEGRPWLREALDTKDKMQIESALGALDDAELRSHLRSIFQRQVQVDKIRSKS